MKILTITVPSYNVELYLERTLFSFTSPEVLDKLEVLIVNDGSTDNTAEIAQKFCDKYPQTFTLINKPNGGHGSTINAGIKAATGKFFKVVDGDDWLDPDSLTKLIDKLEKCDADVVSMHYNVINMNSGDGWDVKETGIKYDKIYTPDQLDFDIRYFSIHSVLYKTSLLKDNDIVISEKIFYVDVEFTLMPLVYAKSFCFFDLSLYRYVVGNPNQSVSNANYVKRYEHHNTVMKNCINFMNEHKNSMHPEIYKYIHRILSLCLQTQYKICFEFDENRKRGIERQIILDKFIETNSPSLYKEIARQNTHIRLLRKVSFDPDKYNRLFKVRASSILQRLLPGRIYSIIHKIFK